MYFVTAVFPEELLPHYGTCCFGYYPTEAEARAAVARNALNMQELTYHDLVIEEVPAGVYPTFKEIAWFHWDEATESWLPGERPAFLPPHGQFAFC